MTVEEFEDFLGEVVDNLETLDNDLVPLVNRIVADLKRDAPVDTGRLRDSIEGIVANNTVIFSLADHGLYQNFGVDASEGVNLKEGSIKPFGIEIEGLGTFGNYSYKTRKYGIPARPWMDIPDILGRIVREIERLAQQNIE